MQNERLGKSFYSLSFNFQKSFEFHSLSDNQSNNQSSLSIYYNIPKFRILGCYKSVMLLFFPSKNVLFVKHWLILTTYSFTFFFVIVVSFWLLFVCQFIDGCWSTRQRVLVDNPLDTDISRNSNPFHHETLERRWHDFFHLFKWQGVLKIFEFHLENISTSETLCNSMIFTSEDKMTSSKHMKYELGVSKN